MNSAGPEHILLIGDDHREMVTALERATPGATIMVAESIFDGIAELSAGRYHAVLAAAAPLERRPEAAVRSLRQSAGAGKLILFGQPDLEPISRKMLDFGCDDYIITPASTRQLQQVLASPLLDHNPSGSLVNADYSPETAPEEPAAALLEGLSLTKIFLDALVLHPTDPVAAFIKRFNELSVSAMRLVVTPAGVAAPPANEGYELISPQLETLAGSSPTVHLFLATGGDSIAARQFLTQLVGLLGKLMALQERHNSLQKLATTDQLTGAANRRYFEHFLKSVIERARVKRLSATLLLFDIDNFKKYNDQYGHGVGDEILRETAALMKRCSREHDLVARIGGDEFAVVFWDKEARRQPKDPAATPAGPPHDPTQVFERFRRLMATQDFPGLGKNGRGKLTISGGLASYPWDGRDVKELVAAADHRLMFGAKRAGKNKLFLVDEEIGGAENSKQKMEEEEHGS